jgi:hypothetical protein
MSLMGAAPFLDASMLPPTTDITLTCDDADRSLNRVGIGAFAG